jgi:aspartyl-tRNA(Asn)/glutamyl-tRNA(Gln) amidotransferase subunit C
MQINESLIEGLANLSRLEFSSNEKAAIKNDLERMISFVEKLKEVDTSDTTPLFHMADGSDVYRTDIVSGSMDRATSLNNAPKSSEQYFKVPKVIQK